MPELQAFRALRFDPGVVGSLADVISPPYDVISPERQAILAARHPRNAVWVDLPPAEPGDDPEVKYRRAGAAFAAWRADGTLRADPEPGVYAYEQSFTLPGGSERRLQRGFFARLRLEPFGPGSGVLPHERTMSGPKEDRYRLMEATAANLSPVVILYRDGPDRPAERALAEICESPALIDVTDDEGVRHRVWRDLAGGPGSPGAVLLATAGAAPLTIADGHHRYETALRYAHEHGALPPAGPLPPAPAPVDGSSADRILTLLLAADHGLAVLATHRVVRGGPSGAGLIEACRELFEVEPMATARELIAAFPPGAAGPGGRFGLWTGERAAILRARPSAFGPVVDPAAAETLRWLDVSLLAVALERLAGLDREAAAAGGRLTYTKDAAEAVALVDRRDGDAAFLLDPTPPEDVIEVAAAGGVMPQKSTYFYPKPVSGLLFNPFDL
jgi:uncharacterized protein (DUF1015 family)